MTDLRTAPLGYVAAIRPSGVDKLTVDGEQPVQLCNYTDVYYGDRITRSETFMRASATSDEIRRFTLQRDDVLITKDSETADDIAVSAWVAEELPGVLLGYHASLIRPRPGLDGRYLHWVLQSQPLRAYFERHARGVTRCALRQQDVAAAEIPLRPIAGQRRIADYLDTEAARIDTLIAKNEQVTELAWERYRTQRRTVLAGGRLLGDPEVSGLLTSRGGWSLVPLWMVATNHDARRVPLNTSERGARPGPYPYWGANSVQGHIDGWLFDGPHVLIGEDGAPFFDDRRDVAWVADGRFWVNNHAHVLEARMVEPGWLAECLNVVDYAQFVAGSTRDKLTQIDLNRIPIPVAPADDQRHHLAELRSLRSRTESLARAVARNTALLRERREALLTAAVTGELEV